MNEKRPIARTIPHRCAWGGRIEAQHVGPRPVTSPNPPSRGVTRARNTFFGGAFRADDFRPKPPTQ
jgi:hypothetical protein